MKKRGFTLIELLVVIAIIGLLSSIVLTSLSTARNKAKDAAIKEEMVALRPEAELGYQISDNTYEAGICVGGSSFARLFLAIAAKTENGSANNIFCGQNAPNNPPTRATAWGVAVTLNDTSTFCVDSTGFAGPSAVAAGTEIERNIFLNQVSTDFTCNND